jgi:hypothetical protein
MLSPRVRVSHQLRCPRKRGGQRWHARGIEAVRALRSLLESDGPEVFSKILRSRHTAECLAARSSIGGTDPSGTKIFLLRIRAERRGRGTTGTRTIASAKKRTVTLWPPAAARGPARLVAAKERVRTCQSKVGDAARPRKIDAQLGRKGDGEARVGMRGEEERWRGASWDA